MSTIDWVEAGSYTDIKYHKAEGIAKITINRPERRNALSNALRGELLDVLQRSDGDDAVRVTILRGAGPCFSSGYDLKSDLTADQPYFTSDVGTINQLVHIWKFEDDAERRAFWARLFQDEDFMNFAANIRPSILSQEVKLLLNAPWGPKP